MQYRVEEVAARAGVRVDTVRYYQTRGLIPAPSREGRIALYGEDHLARLRRIRQLSAEGLPLAVIQRVLNREAAGGSGDAPLLDALLSEHVGTRTLTRAELASEAGIPEALVAAAQTAGLLEPLLVDGEERFSQADLDMVEAGLGVLGQGFPLQELLALAGDHAAAVRDVADRAIDLFNEHVRKSPAAADDTSAVTEAFRRLLPPATRLVALHFQRTLVNRALHRLAESGDHDALRAALAAAEGSSLEVAWK